MRRLSILLALALGVGVPFVASAKGSRSSHSSSSSSSSRSSSGKSVHVGGYTTKGGKYVAPHDRAPPGQGTPRKSSYSGSPSKVYSTLKGASTSKSSGANNERSASAKNSFRKNHPCPSTGKTTGACPGYEVDHISPLACGGADSASNMQWLTKNQNRSKGAAGCARR